MIWGHIDNRRSSTKFQYKASWWEDSITCCSHADSNHELTAPWVARDQTWRENHLCSVIPFAQMASVWHQPVIGCCIHSCLRHVWKAFNHPYSLRAQSDRVTYSWQAAVMSVSWSQHRHTPVSIFLCGFHSICSKGAAKLSLQCALLFCHEQVFWIYFSINTDAFDCVIRLAWLTASVWKSQR